MRANIKLSLVFFLFTLTISAQGIDDVFSVNAVAYWHEREQELLVEIQDGQTQILVATTTMAYAAAELMATEKRLHKAYNTLEGIVDNAEIILDIIRLSEEIIEQQDLLFEYASEHEEQMILAASLEVELLKRATDAIVYLLSATKETKFNLMNNKQRLEMLERVRNILVEIKSDASYARTMVMTNGLYEASILGVNQGVFVNDYSEGLLEDAIENYGVIFNN